VKVKIDAVVALTHIAEDEARVQLDYAVGNAASPEVRLAAIQAVVLSARRASRPELIEDEYGHDDCFDWTGPVAVAGRLWIDAETHDVLRLDRHIDGPTDVRVPPRLQSKYRFPGWLTIDRDDMTLRFKPVTFSDPDETLLLPESIESLTVLRTGLQSTRRTQEFSNYRRFLPSSRIREDDRCVGHGRIAGARTGCPGVTPSTIRPFVTA